MKIKSWLNYIFPALAFLLPFGMFNFTHSHSLGFADAGEFALVTKIASVAHGPGTPSYVFFGWIWSSIASLFGLGHFKAIMLFSIVSTASASCLMYLTIARLLNRVYPGTEIIYQQIIALCTALAFSSGFTVWYWANNIEVYAFHVFSFSLMLYGLLEYNSSRRTKDLIIAATGMALGLADHHLTTVLFLPVVLFFFGQNLFPKTVVIKQPAKKKKNENKTSPNLLFAFIRSKQFIIFSGVAVLLTAFFYGWMMIRATASLPFMFGQPDNLQRFFYHITGGAWMNKTTAQVEGIFGMRFPYFLWLLERQYSIFLLVMLVGFVELLRKGWSRFAIIILVYFSLEQLYQLRLDQVGDSDAYMISPYYMLAFAIPFGAMWLIEKAGNLAGSSKNSPDSPNKVSSASLLPSEKVPEGRMRTEGVVGLPQSKQRIFRTAIVVILPVLVLVQIAWNFPLTDKRQFDLSEGQMKTLDESAPKNSVILIADWTLVSEYYYYRIVENFRPDLTVINYDLKFTNYKILPVLYPEFYKLIKPEYDAFIRELGTAHPQEIYNTGCTLDSRELIQAYANVFQKISAVCKEKNYPLMFDPHAFVYLSQNQLVSPNIFVSSSFVSETKVDTKSNFLHLPYHWLNLPVILHEPGAADKLVDYQAMLDFNSMYYKSKGDTANYNLAVQSHDRIVALQMQLKENCPFTFRETGK